MTKSRARIRLVQEEPTLTGRPRDPWRVLVVTLCCQRARGETAREVCKALFTRHPTAADLVAHLDVRGTAHEPAIFDDDELLLLIATLAPVGFQHKRAASVVQWSKAFAVHGAPRTRQELRDRLTGAGQYTEDVYGALVLQDGIAPTCDDGPLLAWWAQRTKDGLRRTAKEKISLDVRPPA